MAQHGIGVIGCGGIAMGRHIPGYQGLGDMADVLAACDPSQEALAAAREKHGIQRLYASLDELLADDGIDIVSVCTPPDVRESVVIPAVRSGRHALVEKPFSWRLPEAIRMVEAAEAAGVKLAVNQNFRWKEITAKAKEIADSGDLGDLLFVGEEFFTWRDHDTAWRSWVEQLEISVYSIHCIDRVRWLAGRNAESVYCATSHSPAHAARGETFSATTIQFGGEFIGRVTASWCARGMRANQFRVDGTEGSLLAKESGEVWVQMADGEPEQVLDVDPDFTPTFGECMRLLIQGIDGGTEPPHSGRDNLKTMEIVDGAYRAAAAGQAMKLHGSF
ncbi:MAG: Gfo/Idh/MocA family oxidoreductase [Armatimonadota bacterium]|jgi:predicted dehydrogenase